jgi:ABC-type polysaccharide/polyol phosphate transport system ATPase subunit
MNSLLQPEANESRDTLPPAVRVERVVKWFGPTMALAGVDLEVQEGVVFGLLGPNGGSWIHRKGLSPRLGRGLR